MTGSVGSDRGGDDSVDTQHARGVRTFVIGLSGGVGRRLADELVERGDDVGGIVRTPEQRDAARARGASPIVGDLATMSERDLAAAFRGFDVVVFAAGSNGGTRAVTRAIDEEALGRAVAAATTLPGVRFVLLSVLPESWRERDLDDDVEYYFAAKKRAEVLLTRSAVPWLIVRPSLLTDDPATGTVSLGPAELHEEITRSDVATTIAELVHEPAAVRRILEVNRGAQPVADAVRRLVTQ